MALIAVQTALPHNGFEGEIVQSENCTKCVVTNPNTP